METLLKMSDQGAGSLLTKVKWSSGHTWAVHCYSFGHNPPRVTEEWCLLLAERVSCISI